MERVLTSPFGPLLHRARLLVLHALIASVRMRRPVLLAGPGTARQLCRTLADLGHRRVLLVTDAMHALPAQVVRNGARVIVEGDGRVDTLNVDHVAATMDVRPGDLLVSSELEQRFPGGFPVGVVESVVNDPGKPFAVVQARPSAQLDRSRHVLVVTALAPPAAVPPVESADTATEAEPPAPDGESRP